MPSCVTNVTEEHFMFVKWTITYLTVNIIWRKRLGEESSSGGRGRGGHRRAGKAEDGRVRVGGLVWTV